MPPPTLSLRSYKSLLANIENGRLLEITTTILSYAVLLGGLVTIAVAVRLSFIAYMRVPFADMWSAIDSMAKTPPIKWLWLQHNEHRILIPKLFLLADFNFFKGREDFLLISIFVVQLIHFVLWLWILRTIIGLRGSGWRTAAGIAGLCLFSTLQGVNFTSGFQIPFVLLSLFVTVAVSSLLLRKQSNAHHAGLGWRHVCLGLSAGAGATYSLFNGVLIWPVLVTIAVLQRLSKKMVMAIGIAGTLVSVSYLYHFNRAPGSSDPLRSLHAPLRIAEYIAKYLGAPIIWLAPHLVMICGCLGLGVAAYIFRNALDRSEREPTTLLVQALILFYMGTAVVTALGRQILGSDQALSSRYQTFTLIFWMSIGLLLVKHASQSSRTLLLGLQLAVLTLMVLGATRLDFSKQPERLRALRANTASLAILTNVFDQETLKAVFPFPEFIPQVSPFLKERGLSLFSTDLAKHLDQRLEEAYSLRSEPCLGGLDPASIVGANSPPGLRVSGWTWDPIRQEAVSQIVFAAEGKIVGYGEPGYVRPGLKERFFRDKAQYAGWVGFVKPMQRSSPVLVYAVTKGGHGELCRVERLSISPNRPN
ncbi:MAG TPA: hypothetical protein VFA76_06445 [Terriglobales bacterium]|nr:hypothetical protein [Terriglobales bacterium]